jgi:glycogen synthase
MANVICNWLPIKLKSRIMPILFAFCSNISLFSIKKQLTTILPAKMEVKTTKKTKILFEIAWEVCNQVGGIYTVIRTKVPAMVEKWAENYFLIGPYMPATAGAEFEEITSDDGSPLYQTVLYMRSLGLGVHYGHWLITGKPKIVLFELDTMAEQVNEVKGRLWKNHKLNTLNCEALVDKVIAFGEMSLIFLRHCNKENTDTHNILVHFHEWMASTALIEIRHEKLKIGTIFTTHATMLGRYLAGNVKDFYDKLQLFDWKKQAIHYGIEAQATIERLAANLAHVSTTVSDITAKECKYLLGKEPDLILPNGLNITRFTAGHEHQNLHLRFKEKIHKFTMGHFFPSYSINLDKTLYFFTSGRYEYSNKGYDITLEALSRLNNKLKEQKSDMTVVMFFITRQPYYNIEPELLQSRAVLDEIHEITESITEKLGEELFVAAAGTEDLSMPDLNQFVDEYWRLRLRRTIQAWKQSKPPKTVTHQLKNEDELSQAIRHANLLNYKNDNVKVIYHPDFVNSTNPLFGMDYNQFVRGCHMGVFPSYYEPWGYTPLECIARGVPTVTSDLSGFGDYMMQIMKDHSEWGVHVLNRSKDSFDEAAEELAILLQKYINTSRRDRISLRNRVESISEIFDWSNLRSYYDQAHDLAMKRRR